MKTITLGANKITAQGFAKLLNGLNNGDLITTAANAAALQAITGRNLNWLHDLLALPVFKLKSGALSAQGKTLKTYILFHVKGLQIDANGKGKLADQDKLIMREDRTDGGVFSMTYTEFLNRAKAEKAPPVVKPMTGKQLADRLTKLSDALANGLTVENPAQALALVEQAKALYMALDAEATKAADSVQLDTDKAEQLASIKPSAKSKAAPKVKAA